MVEIELAPVILPFSHPSLVRDRLDAWEERGPGYDKDYDFSTLFYDVFHLPDAGKIRAVAPSMLNFEGVLREADFEIGGTLVEPTIHYLQRSAILDFPCSDASNPIHIRHDLFETTSPAGPDVSDQFAGLNVMVAVVKDQHPDWICDWVTYHMAHHNAEAVVLFDNGSTEHTADAMRRKIQAIDGLRTFAVIDAAFPFGPNGNFGMRFKSRFFQLSMLELARHRMLRCARAVLNIDPDELVWGDGSVFDAAVAEGYIRLGGQWIYAPTPQSPPRHADHTRVIPRGGPRTSSKWCVDPSSAIGSTPWYLHRIGPRSIGIHEGFGFWHCRQLSTNWYYDRTVIDPRASQAVDAIMERPRRAWVA